jgi:hypothetical protein
MLWRGAAAWQSRVPPALASPGRELREPSAAWEPREPEMEGREQRQRERPQVPEWRTTPP